MTIRPPQAADLDSLGDLLDGVFRRPRGIIDQSMLTDFPLVFAPDNWRNCRVVIEDGRLVAHAGLWRREALIDGVRLNVGVLVSVATHPDYRQRGYAAEAVKALQSQMQAESYDLGLLWTGVPDFYLKLGWELARVQGCMVTLDPAFFEIASPPGVAVMRFEPGLHSAAVCALHEREPIRFLRSPEEANALLNLPKIETWVAARAGEVLGYLVHATGCNKRGLTEYGGSLEAITTLVGHVARRQPAEVELPLLLYHARPDLTEWARQTGMPLTPLPSSKGFGQEMLFAVGEQPISPAARNRLFVWGLDQA